VYQNESGYMQLLQDALLGKPYQSRAGSCYKQHNVAIEFTELPIQTVRRHSPVSCWREMLMFLSGETSTLELEKNGIAWWTEHTSREFLDSRGLFSEPVGSLGKSYSYQWRHPANDQLAALVHNLNTDPFSRRLAIDLWGVQDQSQMPLLPCWYRCSFYTTIGADNKKQLNMIVDSRSCDLLFGFWQAALQYALFQQALVTLLGWRWSVGSTTFRIVDAHVYENQVPYVLELLRRTVPDRQKPMSAVLQNQCCGLSVDKLLAIESSDWSIEHYVFNGSAMKTPRPDISV
jgi:thymidylate synthase